MSYFERKLLPWFIDAVNIAVYTAFAALATTTGVGAVQSGTVLNLQSEWNAEVTIRTFLVIWLSQFSVAFLAYLKQSPIPKP